MDGDGCVVKVRECIRVSGRMALVTDKENIFQKIWHTGANGKTMSFMDLVSTDMETLFTEVSGKIVVMMEKARNLNAVNLYTEAAIYKTTTMDSGSITSGTYLYTRDILSKERST